MMASEYKKSLYRFRHLQGEHREWTKQILTESVMYFASPADFNDPFDCKVHYHGKLGLPQLREYYVRLLRERSPSVSEKQIIERVNRDLETCDPDFFLGQIKYGMQAAANTLGILSLSATYSNILLWSHYAASHTGLCLKFSTTKPHPFFKLAQEVHYSKHYPQVHLLNHNANQQVQSFLLTKALDWRYENEWRIIDSVHGPGLTPYPEDALVGVIFGARMDPKDKKEVLGWLNQRGGDVDVLQASLNEGTFSLKFEKC